MILPTIHLNGTSVEALMEANDKAYQALGLAFSDLRQAAPNGRDYYTQGPEALGKAVEEHEARLRAIYGVMLELETIGEYLATEQEKRRKPRA